MPERRVAVHLLLEVAKYLKGGSEAVTVTRRVKAELDHLGDEADHTSRDMDELALHTAAAKRQVDDLGDEAMGTSAQLAVMGREAHSAGSTHKQLKTETFDLAEAVKKAWTEVQRLTAEFKRTGDPSLLKDLRKAKREFQELANVAKSAGGAASGLGGGLDFGGSGIRPMHALIGAAVAAAALAAPTIGAMVAGAVTGTVGLGGIAGGIFAASRDPGVERAWGLFAENVSSKFFQMGGNFAEPLVNAAGTVEEAFDNLHLQEAFDKVAPFVDDLATGISGFAENFSLGLMKTLDVAGPILEILGRELPDIGDALGYMFSQMAEGDGTIEGFLFLMGTVEALLKGTGNVIGFLSDEFHKWLRFLANFTGAMEDIPQAFGLQEKWAKANDVVEDFMKQADVGQQVLYHVSKGFFDTSVSVDQTTKAINKLNDAMAEQQSKLLALNDATLTYEGDLINLRKAVEEHGTSLDRTTEKGHNNRVMIDGMIGDLQRQRQAAIDAGGGTIEATDKANKAYQKQIEGLKKLLIHLGFNEAEIRRIISAYLDIPTMIKTEIILDYRTRGVPPGEHSGPRIGETRGRAAGGPVNAGELYRVNETGMEYFRPAVSGSVIPMGQLPNGAGWSGPATNARPLVINVMGHRGMQALVDDVVREVGNRGGTLAVVGVR